MPALFVVMAACVPFAYSLLSPDDLKDFAQSLAAISLFASNILFWAESGYFDTQAELKPLLHTWSLAIEEQFYVIFPLLLWAAWRLGIRCLMAVIAMVAAVSLFLSVSEVVRFPSAAFYLLPSRAWELLAGALTAFIAHRQRGPLTVPLRHPLAGEALGITGLAMILYCICGYDQQTAFPGLNAVLPVLGTGLLLLFATHNTRIGRMLACSPLVGLGLISYSAYLWHQPLFAFTKHALLADLPQALAVVLCVSTVVLAYLSWRYVEQPFRDRSRISRTGIFVVSGVGVLLFLGLGAVGHRMSDRITEIRLRSVNPTLRTQIRTRESLVADRNAFVADFLPSAEAPFSGGVGTRRVLILGDSVSEDLYAAVMVNAGLFPGIEFRRVALDEPCMVEFARFVKTGEFLTGSDELICRKSLEQLRDGSLFGEADTIVLCSNWPRYITHSTHEGAMMLAETLAAQGREVCIVGLMSMQEASSTTFMAIKRGLSAEQANRFAYGTIQRSKIETPNNDARAIASRIPNVRFLDKYAVFADDDARSVLLYDANGQILFADNFHLTKAGGLYFGSRIAALSWFDGKSHAAPRNVP